MKPFVLLSSLFIHSIHSFQLHSTDRQTFTSKRNKFSIYHIHTTQYNDTHSKTFQISSPFSFSRSLLFFLLSLSPHHNHPLATGVLGALRSAKRSSQFFIPPNRDGNTSSSIKYFTRNSFTSSPTMATWRWEWGKRREKEGKRRRKRRELIGRNEEESSKGHRKKKGQNRRINNKLFKKDTNSHKRIGKDKERGRGMLLWVTLARVRGSSHGATIPQAMRNIQLVLMTNEYAIRWERERERKKERNQQQTNSESKRRMCECDNWQSHNPRDIQKRLFFSPLSHVMHSLQGSSSAASRWRTWEESNPHYSIPNSTTKKRVRRREKWKEERRMREREREREIWICTCMSQIMTKLPSSGTIWDTPKERKEEEGEEE